MDIDIEKLARLPMEEFQTELATLIVIEKNRLTQGKSEEYTRGFSDGYNMGMDLCFKFIRHRLEHGRIIT